MAGIPSIPKINRFLTSGDGDKLSLDLQFATDKTLVARRGPTPTFTRASTATFIGSDGLIQSAAINQARFDHDPVTLDCKGLLMEESRTNLLARSAEIGNAYWTYSNVSISSDNQTSPDGGLNAETITVSAGTPSVYRAVSCTASTVYTLSFYIKIGTITPSDFKFAVRDDTNGVFIAENIIPNVTPVTTEWRRVTYTFTTPVGCVTVRPYIVRYGYLSAGTFFLWGAQLEAGGFATSYIPTTTASVVRSADICSITGSDFTGFYNQSEGTIVGSGSTNQLATNPTPELFRSNDGTNNNRIQIGMTNTPGQAIRPFIVASGTVTYSSTQGTATVGVERKVGTAYKTNDAISAFNGTLGTLDTTVTLPTNCIQLNLFASFGVGTISSLRYFKKRLPNAKLQTLTT